MEQINSLKTTRRRRLQLDPDDQKAVCKVIQNECGGLSEGVMHTSSTVGDASFLFYKHFHCNCYGSRSGESLGR